MSNTNLAKQYYQIFSRVARTYDETNDTIKRDRLLLLLDRKVGPRNTSSLKNCKSFVPVVVSKCEDKESAVFRSLSREEYYKANGIKSNGPIYAHYNVSSDVLRRKIPAADIKLRPQTRSKVKKPVEDLEMKVVDKPSPRVQVPVDMKKQIGRKFEYGSLNDHRFDVFNSTPDILSTVKRVSTPNFSKGKGHSYHIKQCSNSAFYDVVIDTVKNDTSKPVVEFGKTRPRKPLLVEGFTGIEYPNINYNLTCRATSSYSFKESGDKTGKLPLFMNVGFI